MLVNFGKYIVIAVLAISFGSISFTGNVHASDLRDALLKAQQKQNENQTRNRAPVAQTQYPIITQPAKTSNPNTRSTSTTQNNAAAFNSITNGFQNKTTQPLKAPVVQGISADDAAYLRELYAAESGRKQAFQDSYTPPSYLQNFQANAAASTSQAAGAVGQIGAQAEQNTPQQSGQSSFSGSSGTSGGSSFTGGGSSDTGSFRNLQIR